MHLRFLFIFTLFMMIRAEADVSKCTASLRNTDVKAYSVPTDKRAYFKMVSRVVSENRERFRQLLLRYDNIPGTDLEMELVERLLDDELDIELFNLERTPTLDNVVVYGATNVPFYTLVAHGIVPKSISKNVWFRTPELTRELYLDLYRLFEELLPRGTLAGLNLVTDKKQVQYDSFNKIYVMGMNKHGTRRETQPADMVIFTGNPDTARTLVESNISKLREKAAALGFPPFKQVFLGFGAGVNPIIIPESAKTNLEQVIFWSMEPVRINSGQDCLAADFLAVHQNVSEAYVNGLITEIRKLKPGSNTDPDAGFTPLTMNKRFDLLKEYRTKYEKYLANKDATIDEETKLVSPHVFVFPASEFKNVHLQEHFAPFFTIFIYEGEQDLVSMARDERVQNKTMYASVYGGHAAASDVSEARFLFRSTRHHVLVNETLFGDLHPNMPYGGRGQMTSMIVNLKYSRDTGVVVTTGHRPKLFSSEAYQAFGPPTVEQKVNFLSEWDFPQLLSNLTQLAAQDPRLTKFYEPNWKDLKYPQLTPRPRGLKALQELIAQEGLYIATEETITDRAAYIGLFGVAPIPLPAGPASRPMKVRGVVLHPSNVGDSARLLNKVHGSANPHLGWGNLHGLLDRNKYLEYILAESVQPGIMAHTENFAILKQHGSLSKTYIENRLTLKEALNKIVAQKNSLTSEQRESLREQLLGLVNELFSNLRKDFPEGGYIKNYGDFATADLGTQITTFSTPTKPIVDEFLRRFEQSLHEIYTQGLSFDTIDFQSRMLSNKWELGGIFLNKLLLKDDEFLIQSRVKIARTELGAPLELRVDFVDGEPVHTRARFSNEYLPIEINGAASVIRNFFERAPEEYRYLSGGADVALLEDGTWSIIEFNFGNMSGSLDPRHFPVDANLFYSKLANKQTPFIHELETIFNAGPKAQLSYLMKLHHVRPIFRKTDLSEISVAEVGKYFRDRYLQQYDLNPSASKATEVLGEIHQILQPWEEQEDVSNLIKGAEYYLKKQ